MKKSRRLKLKALNAFEHSTTSPVALLFQRMATGYKPKTSTLGTRVKNWFIRSTPERNYPTVPWGGAKEIARRQMQLPWAERQAA